MKDLRVNSENYRDALKNLRWKWYCGAKTELALKKIDHLLEDEMSGTPEEFLRKVKFPKFISREDVLLQIADRIESFSAARTGSDEEIYTQLAEPEETVPSDDDDMRDVLKNEKEQIDALILKTRRHIRRTRLHLEDIGLDHDEFRLIQNSIIVAGLLFIFGVALPLSFLRVSNGTNEMF